MPIRRIDSLRPAGSSEDLGAITNGDEAEATPTGFDSKDQLDVAEQPGSLDAVGSDQFNTSELQIDSLSDQLTASQKSQISDAAAKLLSDLPEIARSANYDTPKIADGVNSHIRESVSQMTTYGNLGSLGDQDIEAIAFLVMMEASKSAQEDLKSIMDGVKLINKQKDGWRTVSDTINKMTASFASDDDDDDK